MDHHILSGRAYFAFVLRKLSWRVKVQWHLWDKCGPMTPWWLGGGSGRQVTFGHGMVIFGYVDQVDWKSTWSTYKCTGIISDVAASFLSNSIHSLFERDTKGMSLPTSAPLRTSRIDGIVHFICTG